MRILALALLACAPEPELTVNQSKVTHHACIDHYTVLGSDDPEMECSDGGVGVNPLIQMRHQDCITGYMLAGGTYNDGATTCCATLTGMEAMCE